MRRNNVDPVLSDVVLILNMHDASRNLSDWIVDST